jgi:O-antigen/teichoic acid export membrane protein
MTRGVDTRGRTLMLRQGVLATLARPVLTNAATLFGSTAVTSLLGFAFWASAARLYPIGAVGSASAAVSAMQLVATVGVLGLGTLIIGEVAASPRPSGSALISAATLTAAACSALVAVAYVLTAPLTSAYLGRLGTGGGAVLFVSGAAVTGFTIVLDQACIGLSRGGLQFWRNAVFAAVKLALLPLGLAAPAERGASAIYGVWFFANVISMVTFWLHVRHRGTRPRMSPEWGLLRSLRGTALTHHWLNLASGAPRLLLPALVASVLTPELNAAFYVALLIVGFATIVPAHLATALFAVGEGDVTALARELRATLGVSVAASLVSGGLFAVLAGPILSLLGHGYGVATSSMIVLGITTLPFTVKVHYGAVSRVRGTLARCAAVMTAAGILEVVACYLGARWAGLVGVSTGLLLAHVLEATFMWPVVAGAAGIRVFRRPAWSSDAH